MISFFFFFIKPLIYGFVFFFFCENLWPVGFVCNLLGTWACHGLASVTISFFIFIFFYFSSNLFFWAFFFLLESRTNNFFLKKI